MIDIVRIFGVPMLFPAVVFGSIILELLVRSFSNKINQIMFLAGLLIASQVGFFFKFKRPNIYEELGISRLDPLQSRNATLENPSNFSYDFILQNRERLLFYEKYHSLSDDLNIIRSSGFKNDHIVQSLNVYLLFLMVGIAITQESKYHSSRTIIISVVLILFAYEASLALETDLETLRKQTLVSQFTVKENMLLIKSFILTILVALKYILSEVTDYREEALISTKKQIDHVQKKMEDSDPDLQAELQQTARMLQEVEKLSLDISKTKRWLSTENVQKVMFCFTIYLLFTGDYEK